MRRSSSGWRGPVGGMASWYPSRTAPARHRWPAPRTLRHSTDSQPAAIPLGSRGSSRGDGERATRSFLASYRTRPGKERGMSKVLQYGGVVASVILIAFGVGSIVTGFNGRDRVRDDLKREQIVGTEDSTIPNQVVDTGSEAEAFATVMRKHTMEATG